MQEEQQYNNELFQVTIDDTAREHLQAAARWARLVGILGLVGAGLSFVNTMIRSGGTAAMAGGILGGLIALGISIGLNLLLLRFASQVSAGIATDNQYQLNEGAGNLSGYFKFLGILVIIALSLMVLVVLMISSFGMGRALGI